MNYLTIIFLCLSLMLGVSAAAQTPASESATSDSPPNVGPQQEIVLDRIAAVVNDGIVLESELNQQMSVVVRSLSAQGVEMPPVSILRKQVLESLILKRIQLQRIERLGMTVSDEEVNRSLQLLAQQNGLTLSDLPAALASEGIDYAAYRENIREQMALEQLRIRDVSARVTVTRLEIDKIIADNAPDNLEYEVLHLLVGTSGGASEEELAEARQKAEDLYQRLIDGEEFGPLAIAYSNAPGVLTNRGNLGYLKANALPSIFAETVQAMRPGQTAPPVKSQSGFHIVQLKDIRGIEKVMTEQRLARHILIQPSQILSDEQAGAKILEIQARLQDGEDFAEIARAESADVASGSNGGELGWSTPGNFVPEFEQALGKLKKNEISEPFRTQFGWHIVQLLDTRGYDATLDVRRNQAAMELRNRKTEEEAQAWISQLRDEAYVEIRLDDIS